MDQALVIRLARPDERGALIALQRRASLIWEEDRPFLLTHPGAIDLPPDQIAAGQVFVCRTAGTTIGFYVLLPRDDGQAELDGLFVEPSAWGHGIGRGLVEHAADIARGRGCAALHVIGNQRALGFYRACGFTVGAEAETRFNPGVAMVRLL